MPGKSLLLNWVYYYPVGHAIEAFKTAKGLAAANPGLEIHLLLNSRTPVELASACDWITHAYPVDVEDVALRGAQAASLQEIPTEWDYIVNDHRVTLSPFPFQSSLRAFHDLAETHFHAREWRGGQHELLHGGSVGYVRNATMRMRVPESATNFLNTLSLAPVNICLVPGGSNPDPIYPNSAWWRRAMAVLLDTFPDAHFFLTGKTVPDERSSTAAWSPRMVSELAALSPRIADCFDAGLWNQAALIERCDLLIAPHTGFAFLAPSLGTPWLAISGARWPECYFNEVPFYCVFPTCTHYPCWRGMKPECAARISAGETVACMNEDLDSRLTDLVEGAQLLVSRQLTYQSAMTLYQSRIDLLGLAKSNFFQIA